ncbi:LppM family (lipo)protein [Stackebrandtia nassauensis]|uniref:LppM family (lipo)protein n=1 Tax=Stackebrandtia nassauensis TaxID=283811 RepID=UPI001185FD29|nr:hypothetical protein [Stackebrandtia nassauensis]
MTNSFRRAALVASTLVFAVVALTGCIKVDLAATIKPDDTVDGELTAAVNIEALDAIGDEEADEFVKALTDDIPGATRAEPYNDGEFVGKTVHFADVPLAKFNASETDEAEDAQLSITHDEGHYILNGEWDLPRADTGGSFPDLDKEIVNSAEFSVKVTFPGPVIAHNGDLDGQTVTWNLELGKNNILRAESDQASNTALALWVLAIMVVLTLLVMLLLYLQLRRHSVAG